MKTLHFPAEELEAWEQKVTSPQLLSREKSSKEEMQCKTLSLETKALADELLCDCQQFICPLWACLPLKNEAAGWR